MKTIAAQSRLPFILLAFLLVGSLVVTFLKYPSFIFSATANHIVISEVQVSGGSADDEFIELYNPTGSDVDLSSWSIQNENTSGTFSKKNFEASDSIPAHGYFLIAHSSYDGSVTPDMSHSTFSMSSTGTTVFLVNNQTELTTGDESTRVDKLGLGSDALDSEGTHFSTVPGNDASVERKPGEESPSAGNGEDTDNNSLDFAERTTSEPQNSASSAETPPVPTVPVTPPITLYALLFGKNEVPPVDTPADGYASFIFDFSDNTFDLNLSAQYIALADLAGSHIHIGGIGEEGGVIVDLGPVGEWQQEPNDIIRRIIQDMEFPQEYIDELIAGNTYINIHTSDNPDGEIRGQLSTQWPPPDATISISPTPTIIPTESPSPTVTPTEEPSPTLTPSPEPSPTEVPSPTVTPTDQPTPTLSPSPEPSPTLIPTETPTSTPSPSPEPTASATPSPEPTATLTPSPEPSVTLSVTATPSPVPSPSLSPTPAPQGLLVGLFNFPGRQTTCRLRFTRVNVMWTFFVFPSITCSKS